MTDYHHLNINIKKKDETQEQMIFRRLIEQAQLYNEDAPGLVKRAIQENDRNALQLVLSYEMGRLHYPLPNEAWMARAVDYCLTYLTREEE